MSTLSPRRAAGLSLMALAAGLMLVGTAPARADDKAADDPVVATVNGTKILRSQVVEEIQQMDPRAAQMPIEMIFPQALDYTVSRTLLKQAADKAKLDNDPDVVKRLAAAKESVMMSVYLDHAVRAKVNDAAVKAAYEDFLKANPPEPEIKARHILVDSEDKAKDIIKQLNDGADFADLANKESKDGNGKTGGDLGWFTKDKMVPEFADAAFKIEPGSYSTEPVKSQFGWHVIKVEDKRMTAPPTLDEKRDELEQQLSQKAVQEVLADLRSDAKIEKFDSNGKPVAP
jgi:peptidyl-prolyl cis-trans isomerase C